MLSKKISRLLLSGAFLVALLIGASPARADSWGVQASCAAPQKSAVEAAQRSAAAWLDKVVASYPSVNNQKDPAYTTYTTWMGPLQKGEIAGWVKAVYSQVQGYMNNGKVQVLCETGAVAPASPCATPNVIAYTMVPTTAPITIPLEIHLCGPFFAGGDANRPIRTLIHELAHRTQQGSVIDFAPMPALSPYPGSTAYGDENVRWLAANNPDAAMKNAENYSLLAQAMSTVRLP